MYYDYEKELNAEIRRQRRHGKAITSDAAWRYNNFGSAEVARSTWNEIGYAIMEGLGLNRMEAESYLANL